MKTIAQDKSVCVVCVCVCVFYVCVCVCSFWPCDVRPLRSPKKNQTRSRPWAAEPAMWCLLLAGGPKALSTSAWR